MPLSSSNGEQLEAGLLVVAFRRRGDRFAQHIGVRAGGTAGQGESNAPDGSAEQAQSNSPIVWLLESLEGDQEESWPESPPLQELSLENRGPGKRVLLGVGMAGKSHWSLAAAEDGAGNQIQFEAACRAHTRPPVLASTYRVSVGIACRSLDDQLELSIGPLRVTITLREDSSADAVRLSWDPHTSVIRVRPSFADGRWPQTISWHYVLRCEPIDT